MLINARESFKRKCFEDVAEVNGGKLIVPLINVIMDTLLHIKVKGKMFLLIIYRGSIKE